MKNLVKALFVFAVSAFVLTSCNKEKAAVKKLDGEWHLKSQSASEESKSCDSSATVEDPEVHFTFTAYTVGDEEKGKGTQKITFDGNTITSKFDYSVDEKAEKLTLTPEGSSTSDVYTIEKLTKSKSKFSIVRKDVQIYTACENGYPASPENKEVTYTLELEKE